MTTTMMIIDALSSYSNNNINNTPTTSAADEDLYIPFLHWFSEEIEFYFLCKTKKKQKSSGNKETKGKRWKCCAHVFAIAMVGIGWLRAVCELCASNFFVMIRFYSSRVSQANRCLNYTVCECVPQVECSKKCIVFPTGRR